MFNVINIKTGRILFQAPQMELSEEILAANGYWYDEEIDCISTKDEFGSRTNHRLDDVAVEVVMSYREYKQSYSGCPTKRNSYDSANKTIVVYVQM